MRKSISVGGLTKGLLITLEAGVVIGGALLFPGAGILYKEFTKAQWEKARKRGSLRTTINRLEKQQLVSWTEKKGEVILRLTQKGKEKVLQYDTDRMKLKIPDKWDGWWRVILFDIPEEHKPERELFRKKLQDLGLKKLQRSVFITKIPCEDEIDFITHNLGIYRYVTYILAKKIRGLS